LYGNSTYWFEDYKGATISTGGPTPVIAIKDQNDDGVAYIAAPVDLITAPNTQILFSSIPSSEYSRYWNDYPMYPKRGLPDDSGPSEFEKSSPPQGESFQA
jgi:hypothetical protein